MDPILYAYDRVTGALLGTAAFMPNPERPEAPLQPAFTTLEVPPDVPAGQVAIWRGAWGLDADRRGEIWWKGTDPILIEVPGDPAALGLTDKPVLPPAPPPTSCTKLGLKRAFAEKGLWPTVRSYIAADEDRQEDWDLATQIYLTDPLVTDAVAALAAAGIAVDPVDLATRANALVA